MVEYIYIHKRPKSLTKLHLILLVQFIPAWWLQPSLVLVVWLVELLQHVCCELVDHRNLWISHFKSHRMH
jgi:hypothetical protein